MIWLWLFLAPKVLMTAPVLAWADVTVQVDPTHMTLVEVRLGRFDKPTALMRYRGRFAARALGEKGALEEVRFELPLLAEAETDDASDEARRFAEKLRQGASVKATVRVPLPEGAQRIEIVDTLRNQKLKVPLTSAMEPSPSPSTSTRTGAARAGAPPAR